MEKYYPYVRKIDCNYFVKWHLSTKIYSHEKPYERLDDKTYKSKSGEIKEFRKSELKGNNLDSVAKTFNRLYDLIQCNYNFSDNLIMLTLTYKDMPTLKKVSKDWRNFVSKIRLNLEESFEYIYVVEQQERGSWHIHAFLFFEAEPPYIDKKLIDTYWGYWNKEQNKLIGKGIWSISRGFKDVNDVGAYVCSHCTDKSTEHGKIKYARFKNYPSGSKFYRCSKGIKRPVHTNVDYLTYLEEKPIDRFKLKESDSILVLGNLKYLFKYQTFINV